MTPGSLISQRFHNLFYIFAIRINRNEVNILLFKYDQWVLKCSFSMMPLNLDLCSERNRWIFQRFPGCPWLHDDVIKWRHFPRHWPFVREIHRQPVNFPHKGQWRGALTFSLICAWINGWVNNGDAGDLRRHRAHYDVPVMVSPLMTTWYHFVCCVLTTWCSWPFHYD